MFIEMILKTIPRSLRAAVALIVMLSALWTVYNMLPAMLVMGEVSFGRVAGFGLGLIIGIAATILFYYFQSVDGEPEGPHKQLETLNKYYEAEQHARRQNGKDV